MGHQSDTWHAVFLSYYHSDDRQYRSRFEELFGHVFTVKSVELGDMDIDLSTQYIERLIQQDYISDTSVVVVLVGQNTYRRKHVDWEISAALDEKAGGYSGLLGLCLPTHPDYKKDKYHVSVVPPRFVDNLRTGYAELYDWTESASAMKARVEDAFQARISRADKIKNSRMQFVSNK